ncbi:MAG: redoxin family protein [Akkermansia sp.]|nr:redoxin family protein [Akkermansia sp.]
MKHLFTTLALLVGLCVWAMPQVQADDDAPVATKKAGKKNGKKKKATGKLSVVAQALADAGYFTETEARPKARVYIFICSASWCPPCRALMPRIVDEYEKNIKKNKSVSLVLLCADRDEEAAKKYIEHYETDMPGVMKKQVQLENMPSTPGIPWCIYMNAKGELLHSGAGDKVLQWKTLMKSKPQKN